MTRRYFSSSVLAVTLAVNPPAPVTLGVDTTALTSLTPAELGAMKQEAAAIWQAYGVAIVWTPSGTGQDVPLAGPNDTLRIASDGRAPGRSQGAMTTRLGAVLFLEGSGLPDNTLVLSVDAVRRTVEDSKIAGRRLSDWPPSVRDALIGRALGRVLAHELGHYLLIWRSHTPDGLMQPSFRADALVAPSRGPFELSERLVPRLRARLAQLATPGSTVAGVH
jgi:hypothetical protein